jgi:hypothetical protein
VAVVKQVAGGWWIDDWKTGESVWPIQFPLSPDARRRLVGHRTPNDLMTEFIVWLSENVGERGKDWLISHEMGGPEDWALYVRTDKHAVLYKMWWE